MLLSFVIPCYNSEKIVAGVIEEIIQKVAEKPEFDYEIIAVNDGSPDRVYDVLKALASHNKKIKVLDLARNRGKHSAVMAAYHYVNGDIVIVEYHEQVSLAGSSIIQTFKSQSSGQ